MLNQVLCSYDTKVRKKLKHYKYVHAFYKGIKRSGWLRSEGDRLRPRSVPVPRAPTSTASLQEGEEGVSEKGLQPSM